VNISLTDAILQTGVILTATGKPNQKHARKKRSERR